MTTTTTITVGPDAPGLHDHDHCDDDLDELHPNGHSDELHLQRVDGHLDRDDHDPVKAGLRNVGDV